MPIPAGGGVVPSRASSAAPVTTRDSRDLLARSRSSHGGSPAPMSAGVFEGLTPGQLHRVFVALRQHAEIQKMWAAKGEDAPRKPGHASRMTGRVDRQLALTMR